MLRALKIRKKTNKRRKKSNREGQSKDSSYKRQVKNMCIQAR